MKWSCSSGSLALALALIPASSGLHAGPAQRATPRSASPPPGLALEIADFASLPITGLPDGTGNLAIEQVVIGDPGPGEVLVEPLFAGVCGSDNSASLGKPNFAWVKRPRKCTIESLSVLTVPCVPSELRAEKMTSILSALLLPLSWPSRRKSTLPAAVLVRLVKLVSVPLEIVPFSWNV